MSLQEGRLLIDDASTGKRLLSSLELEEANLELEEAKKTAEQQATEMAALLARYQEQFGTLPEDNSTV